MHIQETRRHRHFLALPLFAAALIAVIVSGQSVTVGNVLTQVIHAEEFSATGEDRTITLRKSSAVLFEESKIRSAGDDLDLLEGAVLVAGRGIVTVTVGEVSVSGFQGGFTVSKSGQNVSVVALSTPVLVQNGDQRMLVPKGITSSLNVTTGELSQSLIDEAIARQQLPLLQNLDLPDVAALPQSPAHPFSSILSFPQAEVRANESEKIDVLAKLQAVIRNGDRGEIHRLLSDFITQDALLTAPDETREILLVSAEHIPSAQQEILEYVRDERLWILASFHPAYRIAAWATSGPLAMSEDARILRWLAFPSSDVSDPISESAIGDWESQVKMHLTSTEHPEEFFGQLLASVETYRTHADRFPARMHAYAAAFIRLSEGIHLSEESQKNLSAWESLRIIPEYKEVPSKDQAASALPVFSEPEAMIPPADPKATEARAKQVLLQTGGLFSVQTSLKALSDSVVEFSGIIFATAQSEHVFSGTLDLDGEIVSDIRRDGAPLAFPLKLGLFGRWARGEGVE